MELGSAPDPMGATIALMPVDFLAENICYISQCITEQGNTIANIRNYYGMIKFYELLLGTWAKIFHFDNPNKISFKSIFSWIDKFYNIHKQKRIQMLSHKEWWNVVRTEINASQSLVHEKYHKERLDKLSGLLLFTDGVPNDTILYALENSINVGKVKFPVITDESFTKFISTEFK